ncbi:Uncharacterised protein [Streptococcus pneumoniae]|nr:Uncharacterised protein [Streptococcus pneumoniae]
MAAFIPGASPPLVKTAIRFILVYAPFSFNILLDYITFDFKILLFSVFLAINRFHNDFIQFLL